MLNLANSIFQPIKRHKPVPFGIMELTRNHFYKGDLCHVLYTTKLFRWESLSWLRSEIFSKHHVGKLLAKCNGLKEKGISPISLLRYKLSNIFVGRSMYMQQRTGTFKEGFSKNTFQSFWPYRWLRRGLGSSAIRKISKSNYQGLNIRCTSIKK